MITFNIIQHPDNDFQGTWTWNKNIVSIGPKGDYICANERGEDLVLFEITQEGFTLYPGPSLDHYICNGKRAKAQRKIKLGDNIIIEKYQFQILAFTFIAPVPRITFLKSKFKEIHENNKSLFELISKIENTNH